MDALVEDIGELGEDFGMTRGYWVTIQFNSFLGDYGWEILSVKSYLFTNMNLFRHFFCVGNILPDILSN